MLKFNKSAELPVNQQKNSSKLGYQKSSNNSLVPFTYELQGSSSTIVGVWLISVNNSFQEISSIKLDNGVVSYNSSYDVLISSGDTIPTIPNGNYKLRIQTDDFIIDSEIFTVCALNDLIGIDYDEIGINMLVY